MISGKKLFIVGAGNMAEALIQGLISSHLMKPDSIGFSEVRKDRADYIQKKFGVKYFEHPTEAIKSSDIILFAVKPQNMSDVLKSAAAVGPSSKLWISIAAGVRLDRLESVLPQGSRVVRVMPNMGALVGCGVSGLSGGHHADSGDMEIANALMSAVGETVTLAEKDLDALTAVSGSGPAYFFYLSQAMEEAAQALGLSPEVSAILVRKTALGAAKLMDLANETPEALWKKVASPGGTTEAALKIFEKNNFRELVKKALAAAKNRSEELAK